ncbi:chemotaxis protein [Brachyspira sp.]|uniref:chemotaxis protein n=1 Tax=Brachyspira sp. TaxID=1977261 RepID=UPI003D7EFC89
MPQLEVIDKSISQDITDYSVILETTVKDIESFLQEVGKVYSFIAEKFPVIEQEMKNENERANILLSYFISEDEDKKKFSDDLKENQNDFLKSFDRMQKLIENDNILSEAIIQNVDKINIVVDSIEEIKKLADQIKVYSLNAIVISSKHGAGGKAFGEISKNIINMSENSNEHASQMNKMGHELFERFENFKSEILKINEIQKNNFTIMKEQLYKEHNNMVNSFAAFSNLISNILTRIDNTSDYIFEIMMVLPREDIIRQQTEHIIESIKSIVEENKKFVDYYGSMVEDMDAEELEEEKNKLIEHKLLDLLTFDDLVLTLIIENFKSIYGEISDTNSFIYKNLKEFEEILADISLDRDTIVEYMIGTESGKSEFPFTVSNSIFTEYTNFINLYMENFQISLTNKYKISDNNTTIIDSIEELENMFTETKNIARAFNSINFLSKIELEKNADVFTDSQTFSIESIESIAANITETVDKCLEQFKDIKADIIVSINKFKTNIKSQSNEHDFIESMTGNVNKRLEESKSIIDGNVKRLESHAKELFVLIDKTLIDLSSLNTLMSKIDEINDIFDKMRNIIKEKKDKYYTSLGIENWKIESDKYWDIINSYTIKKERMIANSILSGENAPNVDINIEEGADSGDFTLF